jgi:coiled-coil domain-containing protein 12
VALSRNIRMSRSQVRSADDSMGDANTAAQSQDDEHTMTDDPHSSPSTTSSSSATTSSPSPSSLPPLKFRNYRPKDTSIPYVALPRPSYAADSVWLDGELASLVESAVSHDNADVLLSIAPKSLNWDLKRDLAPKLAALKKQTAKALQELARQHTTTPAHTTLARVG